MNRDEEVLEIHCEKEGDYNVLVFGTRNDPNLSVQQWDNKGAERLATESWEGKKITRKWESGILLGRGEVVEHNNKNYSVHIRHTPEYN